MKPIKNHGVTLIELVIVISVISILVVALGFEFSGWMGSYRIESQVKELYTDLMNSKVRAMQRNRAHFVVINANNYQVFEDTNESGQFDGGDIPLASFANQKIFEFPVDPASWTGTVTLDSRGLVVPNSVIRFDIRNNNPDYDCLLLFPTRINMGRWNGTCIAR